MASLPAGTVTLLFTDVEGSTRLLLQLGPRYPDLLAQHRRLLRTAVEAWGGAEIGTQGDACFAAFPRARDAVAAAIAAQRALAATTWPGGAAVRVRMGIHTGEPLVTEAGYVGMDVHRTARICAAAHGGQVLLSQATRELVADDLPDGVLLRDLGEHRLKDLPRPLRLLQVIVPGLPSDFPPPCSLHGHPHNLPAQLTSFIGREREMAEVKRLIATARLATLTGPGGCGKTRLALQVALDLVEGFADGVWLVELAALPEPAAVPQALATALGLHEEPSRELLSVVCDYLRSRSVLLVLDNCEHLIAACARLVETLLRECPELRILATSRELLAIPGERTYLVLPLSSPDPRDLPPLQTLGRYEAVRLFVDRAALSRPDFGMKNGSVVAIAQVCHQLDGIPLAIELAAARVKTLSVDQIARRLDDRFRLLTAGHRTALRHHQTLRAAMDWSYDLLSEKERMVFRRLAVFAGGFTLDAAEAVGAGDGIDASDILDLLARLVDKSLVTVHRANDEPRYGLLETVRQYGWARLTEAGEAATVRERHRDHFLGVAERAEPALHGPEQAAWLVRLDTEHENFRAALAWCSERGDAEPGARLAVALWWFWYVRGYYREGRTWLEVALHGGAPPGMRAKARAAAGYVAAEQADYGAALSYFAESLEMYRERGDAAGVAESLYGLGRVAWRQGDFDRAAALYTEALALREESGAADRVGLMLNLNSLATLAMARADYATARSFLQSELAIARELGDKRGIALAVGNLGIVAFHQRDYTGARPLLREGLALKWHIGDRRGIIAELESLGLLAAAEGQAERAARLLGAARALGEAIGAPLSPSEQSSLAYDRHLAILQATLPRRAMDAAWAEGRAMTLPEAVEHALAEGA